MKEALSRPLLRALAAADGRTLVRALRSNLRGLQVALVFHRVGQTRDKLRMPAEEIDRIVEAMGEACSALTVSFDDGFREAAEYVLSRAPRLPQVEWLWFVCPEK